MVSIIEKMIFEFLEKGNIFFVYYSDKTTIFEFTANREQVKQFYENKVKETFQKLNKIELNFKNGENTFIVENKEERILFSIVKLK
ncbi:MAG: hypothetical protein ABIL45_04195 [candidate division WOR-3 bacterium]